jgi:hypothetical protein
MGSNFTNTQQISLPECKYLGVKHRSFWSHYCLLTKVNCGDKAQGCGGLYPMYRSDLTFLMFFFPHNHGKKPKKMEGIIL